MSVVVEGALIFRSVLRLEQSILWLILWSKIVDSWLSILPNQI